MVEEHLAHADVFILLTGQEKSGRKRRKRKKKKRRRIERIGAIEAFATKRHVGFHLIKRPFFLL